MRASGGIDPPLVASLSAYSDTISRCLKITSFMLETPDVSLAAKGMVVKSLSAGTSAAKVFESSTCAFDIGGSTIPGGSPPTDLRPWVSSSIASAGASCSAIGKSYSEVLSEVSDKLSSGLSVT